MTQFETAVDALVAGDVDRLRSLLEANPELIRERSARPHRATLLHYLAANGVEEERQKTPPNAVAVMKLLLDAGAEPDALADMYGQQCTTMSMLVSSVHPAAAGLQVALAEALLDAGAALEGSSVLTALAFGYADTAEALAKRGAPLSFAALAGLGRVDDVAPLLPQADAAEKHVALALAAQHGRVAVLRLLLDSGEDASRYNPDGYHAHSTPLHQAVWAAQEEVVQLLVDRGARLDVKDTMYLGTPLDWAIYGERMSIADYLRSRGAPSTS